MTKTDSILGTVLVIGLAISCPSAHTQQSEESLFGSDTALPEVLVDGNDIGGVVTSDNGPEAGVWVIAETEDLGTRFIKSVVTDNEGRYLVPDLPEGTYELWVRGYGLVDSDRVSTAPGQVVDLLATVAPSAAAAAEVYPAIYWYSMMGIPEESELPAGNADVNQYLTTMKNIGCVGCHQMGNRATRTVPEEFSHFDSSVAAWTRRIQSGQAGAEMIADLGPFGAVALERLANWTDRIAAGELPASVPERPRGLERNVVVTVRDWSDPKAYMHDLTTTDRRNPTVNGYGPIYGAPELSTDEFPILVPTANTSTTFTAPVRDPDTPSTSEMPVVQPSVYWGEERIWNSQANAHNPMIDHRGRVWYTARVRGEENPDFCREGSEHPSAQLFPTQTSGRQLAFLEPETLEYTFVDTCFSTHHLQFAEDEDNTLWTSGDFQVIGSLDTDAFDQIGDAAAAQSWSPLILDTNGNGQLDEWVEPGDSPNPELDTRFLAFLYAIMPNPVDGSVWSSSVFTYPGGLVRFDPTTGLSEFYNVPLPGFAVRGADIDRNGVIWVSLGSGHLGEFDRDKCVGPLRGPAATGDHCPEGWTFHDLPGPGFQSLPEFSAESSYYTWVDQHNTSGLGANVPIATGNLHDGVHALVDGAFVTLRVPYPLGFYTKGFEGRIDDPDGGWKGRGLWVPSGDRTPWHREGGTANKPLVVHFQVRPDPLAR